MGSKWIEVSLGEISEKIGDGIHGTPVYNDSGNYYFINGSNLSDNSIKITDTTKRVDHDEFLKHRKELGDNTVLVSINGTIGNTALYNNENIILGKSACYINLKDSISKYFILYILSGYLFQEYIQRCSTGSTIKNVSLKMMRDFRFLMPESKEDQEKAVYIIQKVDERKRLSNAQNQTLEQMSQTLFKSWFVDFDPVIDNALDAGNPIPEALQSRAELRQKVRNSADFKPLPADIRALFPADLEETEMGWVPKEWKNGNLNDVTKILSGFAFKSKDFGDDGKSVIKIKNITTAKTIDIDDTQKISEFIAKDANRFLLLDGDILMAMTGATVGKFGVLTTKNNEEYYLNQRVAKFDTENKAYLYCVLNQESTDRFITNAAQGSAQPNISAKDILSTPLLIPSVELINTFNDIISHLFYRMIANTKANLNLTALRDTLLPKLISGELSLEDLPDLVTQTEPA